MICTREFPNCPSYCPELSWCEYCGNEYCDAEGCECEANEKEETKTEDYPCSGNFETCFFAGDCPKECLEKNSELCPVCKVTYLGCTEELVKANSIDDNGEKICNWCALRIGKVVA